MNILYIYIYYNYEGHQKEERSAMEGKETEDS